MTRGQEAMPELEEARTCFSCGAKAPTTETEYTLIGSKHAWRCKKSNEGGGLQAKLAWYCPSCWKNRRFDAKK
jgi:hypothetical protein